MILKKIEIENLRSYENQKIIFPKGSTLLSGDIGSGKTTILLAIEFALFGLQPSQKASSLLRNGKNQAKVILEFEVDNKKIIIERALKKGKKSISQDYASLTIDDEKFEASITEIKSKILKLLNYPSEFSKKTNLLYKFTVYTPQEEMKQIILEQGDVRLNTLRHVFGVNKYKIIQENASILTSKIREKIRINQALTLELDNDKESLEKKEQNIFDLKQKQIQVEKEYQGLVELRKQKEIILKEIQEKINEKKSLENEKAKSDILISEKQQQTTTLKNSLQNLLQEIQEAKKISFDEQEDNALDQRINFQQTKEDELQKEYIQIISKINSYQSKKLEAESLINKISKLEKCPTCLQNVSEQYKNNILSNAENEIQQIQKNLSELLTKRSSFIEQIEQTKKTKQEFIKRKSELQILKIKLQALEEKQQRILEIEKQIFLMQRDIEILQKHEQTTNESIQELSKYNEIFEQRDKELQEAKQNENNFSIKKAEINKEIQFTEKLINDIKKQIEKKEIIKKQTQYFKELEFWISEKFLEIILFTEKQVMITLKQEFSKLFSQWFSILVSDSLIAKLGDDFSPVITQEDYDLDYSFLSGGERTAIALAYRLSLNQVINSLLSNLKTNNLIILDEPTDGFSTQQLDKMRDVFSQLNTEQLILVSHETRIQDFVDNIIYIKKENGVSEVEQKGY